MRQIFKAIGYAQSHKSSQSNQFANSSLDLNGN